MIHKQQPNTLYNNYNTNKSRDNIYKFNTILYKKKMDSDELLSCNLNESHIISCSINYREVKYLTYASILTNICLLYNISFKEIINDKNAIMAKIIQLVISNNIAFEIIIKLSNFQFVEYKHQKHH